MLGEKDLEELCLLVSASLVVILSRWLDFELYLMIKEIFECEGFLDPICGIQLPGISQSWASFAR